MVMDERGSWRSLTDESLKQIARELTVIKWMLATNIVLTVGVLIRLLFSMGAHGCC